MCSVNTIIDDMAEGDEVCWQSTACSCMYIAYQTQNADVTSSQQALKTIEMPETNDLAVEDEVRDNPYFART